MKGVKEFLIKYSLVLNIIIGLLIGLACIWTMNFNAEVFLAKFYNFTTPFITIIGGLFIYQQLVQNKESQKVTISSFSFEEYKIDVQNIRNEKLEFLNPLHEFTSSKNFNMNNLLELFDEIYYDVTYNNPFKDELFTNDFTKISLDKYNNNNLHDKGEKLIEYIYNFYKKHFDLLKAIIDDDTLIDEQKRILSKRIYVMDLEFFRLCILLLKNRVQFNPEIVKLKKGKYVKDGLFSFTELVLLYKSYSQLDLKKYSKKESFGLLNVFNLKTLKTINYGRPNE